ncbi:MAG: hypothetical protein HC901_03160 [Bdellovibrionaceae bacterium]|nr:hypothetical protein [Pseudobdellovibrionaceae bacterium]
MMKMAMGLEMAHDRQLKTSANQPAQEGGPPMESLEVAVNYLIKIDLYYEAFPA